MPNATARLYDPAFVSDLFDEMSATYGFVNYISSFGFCKRWRLQCVDLAGIEPGHTVYDLMSGMGECWPRINTHLQGCGTLVGLDISPVMCSRAKSQAERVEVPTSVVRADVLANTLPTASADRVVSAFGLKTFSPAQRETLAREVARVLKPGGRFSFLEISVPPAMGLQIPYLFYLRAIIPGIGRLFLGNPANYRLLGVYTTRFGTSRSFGQRLAAQGLHVQYRRFFFGCATGVTGYKPRLNAAVA
jgi:demethylmenaquinone methyltransferase/2-methoxy-6-polyprenyl-1,4-benzoquinol methylase